MKQAIFLFLFILLTSISCFAQEKTVDVAQDIVIGKAIELPLANFPNNCKCKVSKVNTVVIQFSVNREGNVESAKGISGHPLLKAASIAAIRKSKFTISTINHQPIPAVGIITYQYTLSKNKWKTHVIDYELKLEGQ